MVISFSAGFEEGCTTVSVFAARVTASVASVLKEFDDVSSIGEKVAATDF
jgi:hypothetical protein